MHGLKRFWHKNLRRPIVLDYKIQRGKGDTVVLLHGIASNKELWEPLFQQLQATSRTVIALDLLGHGTSPRPNWLGYTTEDQAAAVLATLRKLRVRGKITLVGHSMGSLVSVHIATIRPKFVQKLVLYEPPIFADLTDYPRHLRRRDFYFGIFERLAANPSGGITIAKTLGKLMVSWRMFLESEETWLPIERGLRNSIMQQSIYTELHKVTVPTAIVHGRLDVVVTRTELKKMYKDNTNITFYMTTATHGLNTASARFLTRMIAPEIKARDTKNSKNRGDMTHESNLERPSNRRGPKKRPDLHRT